MLVGGSNGWMSISVGGGVKKEWVGTGSAKDLIKMFHLRRDSGLFQPELQMCLNALLTWVLKRVICASVVSVLDWIQWGFWCYIHSTGLVSFVVIPRKGNDFIWGTKKIINWVSVWYKRFVFNLIIWKK